MTNSDRLDKSAKVASLYSFFKATLSLHPEMFSLNQITSRAKSLLGLLRLRDIASRMFLRLMIQCFVPSTYRLLAAMDKKPINDDSSLFIACFFACVLFGQ